MIIRAGDDNLIKPAMEDGKPVWRWNGTDDLVQHVVRLAGTLDGIVHWEVWRGDTKITDNDLPMLRGHDAALTLIIRWRRAQWDAHTANDALRAHGYPANQHAHTATCNCDRCEATRP